VLFADAALGLRRDVVVVVPGFPDAIRIARRSDLVALVPRSSLGSAATPMAGLASFELPVRTPDIAISAQWHPRMEADPAHRWLRDTVLAVCRRTAPPQGRCV
jgi:DNA-binding transcriptional LysR family regulator